MMGGEFGCQKDYVACPCSRIYTEPIPVQDHYSDDRRVWNAIFEVIAKDLATCEKDGIKIGDGDHDRIWPIVLGNKGDWSYLVPRLSFRNHSTAFV